MSDDEYVIELAKNILSVDDSKYPKLLFDLSRYLETLLDGKDAIKAFVTIWKKNILPIMLLEMKKDYSKIEPRSWSDGFLIVHTVYDILTRIMPATKQEETELHSCLIPDFVENLLCFYRQMQTNFTESLNPGYRGLLTSKELSKEIKRVLELSESFAIRFPDHVITFLQSAWFLQVFISDNDQMNTLMADWLTKLVKINPAAVKRVSKSTIKGIGNILYTVFDEIVYHLAVSSNTKLVETDLKCLLTILEADPSLTCTLHLRYKGLKLLILKWSMPLNQSLKVGFSNSFAKNLRVIIKYLDSGLVFQTDASMHIWAIVKIQAWWRSAAVRLKLNKTNKAFGKFQKSYRSRKAKERKEQNMLRIRKELEHQIAMTRRRKFREKLEAEVLLMETLPAPIVFKHLERNRQDAATSIQAIWRGHRARSQLIARQQLYRKTKAVVKIQKYVRAWLSRRDLAQTNAKLNQNSESSFWHIPGLTVERKAELVKYHNRWMASHKYEFKGMSEDSQLELHHQAQKLYRRHLYGVKASRRQDLDRELTLARLETDSRLLISAPSLTDAIDGVSQPRERPFSVDNFHCKIRPIANRAAQLHRERISAIRQPWWKQLLIEEPSDLDADDDLLPEAVDLDQFMILRNRLDFVQADDDSPFSKFRLGGGDDNRISAE